MKTTITITNTFEVTFNVTPNDAAYRSGPDLDWEDPDDWDFEIEEAVCLETGCPVDESGLEAVDAARAQMLAYFKDNYDPTP
jgi:hypothetical protein